MECVVRQIKEGNKMTMMPVKINGLDFSFSAGKHNELQKAIIEEFAPRFAPNSECLYVGDSDLNFRRSGVTFMGGILFDDFFLQFGCKHNSLLK